jgi:glucokinase
MLVGVDVGGSKIEAALVDGDKIIKKARRATEADKGKNTVLSNITDAIAEIFSGEVEAIGVGLAGPFDPEAEVLTMSPHIPCLIGYPVKTYLEGQFKVKVALDNDARMFTRGVHEFEYNDVKNLVGLTLGTGVGGAVIIDGILQDNPRDTSEELGHMVIVKDGRRCACGEHGCIEAYASGGAVESMFNELTGISLEAKTIIELASGDKEAKKVIEAAGVHLAKGFAVIVDKYNPEVIAIGGGVSEAKELLRIARLEFGKMRPYALVRIEKPKLKDASLLGAALFASRY